MFVNDIVKCTVGDIAQCFSPRGMLSNSAAAVGIYILGQKYKDSEKLVVPYWVTVRRVFYVFCFLCFLYRFLN